MAHFKCTPCRARVWREGADTRDLCPGCGGPLELVLRAEEIIGLRALRSRPRSPQPVAERVRETIARNDAARARRLRSVRPDPPPSDPE